MSRAFVKEDSGDVPRRRFALPEPWDPGYNAAAALALLEAARDGQMQEAEAATGYRWGEPSLHPHIRKLLDQELARPMAEQDGRYIQLARRFLRGL
ncbi:MAG: hypothetical protein FIB01_01745 [Gemmatimonadetes bacterium]|nr:hypothetical protein [Gemmatimonadota bacterium]